MSREFYDAASFGKRDTVRQMLTTDPGLVRSTIKWGFTALHGVAGEEEFEMAEFLLDAGADPNAKNDEGVTPLHLAVYPEMVELLVRRGADINVRAKDGSTPLLVAAAEAQGYEAMEALLRLGADAKAIDNYGQSALDIARSREEVEKIELLRRYGVDPKKHRSERGRATPGTNSEALDHRAHRSVLPSGRMDDPLTALSVDYGIQCNAADEKQLVKNVNAFLASLNYQKMYRWEDTSIQPPERTFRLSHYYCQFIKTHPRWHFDLRPNVDLDGKSRFPDHPDCGWTLFTHKPFPEMYAAQDHDYLNDFFTRLVGALGFPARVIHVYVKGEDRL